MSKILESIEMFFKFIIKYIIELIKLIGIENIVIIFIIGIVIAIIKNNKKP